jgi:hypothetical protein
LHHLVILHPTHESLRRPSIHRVTYKTQRETSSRVVGTLRRMTLVIKTCFSLVLRAERMQTTVRTPLAFWRELYCRKRGSHALHLVNLHATHKSPRRPSIHIRRRFIVLTPLSCRLESSVGIVCQ